MSSKKKNLDEELSDVSSSEESIVNFVKKKDEKQKEEQKEKILSKKTKREKKEESESDSDSVSNGNLKHKKIKKEEKKDNSDNDDSEEKEEKIDFKKNKKIKKDKQEEENSENEKDVQDKKKKKLNNNDHDDKKESDSEQSSQEKEEEKVKPKLKNKPKKEKESDIDSSNSEKSNNNEKDEEENSEPKLVKNPNKTESKEKEEKESKKPKSYNSGTWPELFVNNLSYKTTDESLKNYFSKYGEVESTKIVYDKETGRPKGVGFCKFCDSSSAAKALEDNDNLFLDGRPIAVSYSNDKKGSAKVRKSKFKGNKEYSGEKFSIFIGNLSFKTNEDGIKNLFEDCGNIIDIRIAKRPDGNPRGFAHVDFDTKEGMENALEKSGYLLDGRKLRIDKTTNQPSANKKTFGENSYYKNNNKNKENEDVELSKARKTGKIINTESKSQKIENSDSDSDNDE